MKKFMVIYHMSNSGGWKEMKMKPEDMKKSMEKWMSWAKKCGSGLVDMGSPLGKGTLVSKNGSSKSNKDVVGFSVLQAKDINEAMNLLKNHPHYDYGSGCQIEVHEYMPMPK